MTSQLYAVLFDASDDASPAAPGVLPKAHGIGVRCSLPGWVQKIEVKAIAPSRRQARDWRRQHLGKRLALWDGQTVCSGWVHSIKMDGRVLLYTAAGAWKMHDVDLVTGDPGSIPSSSTISDYFENLVLANHVPYVTVGNSSQMETNSISISSGYDGPSNSNAGLSPRRVIEDVLEIGDGTNIWDYWCLDTAPMQRTQLPYPVTHFKARDSTDEPRWHLQPKDILRGGGGQGENIWDLKRDIEVFYGATPTSAGGTTSSETDYWTTKEVIERPDISTSTIGGYIEAIELLRYEKSIVWDPLIVRKRVLRGYAQKRRPIWHLIKQGPVWIHLNSNGETPEMVWANDTGQGLRGWRIFLTNLDYDHDTRTARIVPDNLDQRIDAVLKRASGVEGAQGEGVGRW